MTNVTKCPSQILRYAQSLRNCFKPANYKHPKISSLASSGFTQWFWVNPEDSQYNAELDLQVLSSSERIPALYAYF